MFLYLILFLILLQSSLAIDETWDLDGPCQIHVQKLAEAQAKMVKCATNFSSPPKVCTNCIDEYIDFKQIEYDTHHLDNITSLDNTTCTNVIYGNYLLSYGYEISAALTRSVWDKSRCSSCLEINWDFKNRNSTIQYDDKTVKFQAVLYDWRDCVTNYSSTIEGDNASTICNQCGKPYEALFLYYWQIYIDPSTDFCVDVETTMNDTMHVWHKVWQCPDDTKTDRQSDVVMLLVSVGALLVILTLFYGGSYVQTERAQRNLIRYSRLEAPRGQRSRLVSSSSFFSSPGASEPTNGVAL
jgi:hypothetical protein